MAARSSKASRPRPAPDPRQLLLESITEAVWQATVIDTAVACGWWHWHDVDPRWNRAGLPDLILVRPPRVLFVELKKQTGKVRAKQDELLTLLGACPGVETYLWRPSNHEHMIRTLGR